MQKFNLSGVEAQETEYKGRKALRVAMLPERAREGVYRPDTDTFAWAPLDFHNGSIEADVAVALTPDAPPHARGFLGLAFRIDEGMRFECIYLRPLNSRCDDQVRRNHSTQYFSFPDYDFARFRKEDPEKYESYADMEFGEWTHMKISVEGSKACLYVNNAEQPCLVVNDLKLGPEQRGGIGFWVEIGSAGYFSGLKVEKTA